MKIQRGLLALLNCKKEAARNLSPGGIHKSGGPQSGSLPLLLAHKETDPRNGGSGGWRLRAEHQTLASQSGRADAIPSDPCLPDRMRAAERSP